MFVLENKMQLSKKEVSFENKDNKTLTIKNDNYGFTGNVVLFSTHEQPIPLIMINKNNNHIAVLTHIDVWSSENDYQYVVFSYSEDQSEAWLNELVSSFDECIFNTQGVLNLAEHELLQIKNDFSCIQVENSSIAAAPNTATFRASVSGKLDVVTKSVSYGDYNSKTYLHVSMQIGSGIDLDSFYLILALSSIVTYLACNKLEKCHRHYKNGTNFSTVGIAA